MQRKITVFLSAGLLALTSIAFATSASNPPMQIANHSRYTQHDGDDAAPPTHNNGFVDTYSQPFNYHRGFYAAFNVGPSYVAASNGTDSSGVWGVGVGLLAGFQFNPYLGLELGSDLFPSRYDNDYYSADFATFHADAKLILPFADVFDLYGKVGGGFVTLNACTSDFYDNSYCSNGTLGALHFAAGLGMNLTHWLELQTEVSNYLVFGNNNQTLNVGMVGLGLTMHLDLPSSH